MLPHTKCVIEKASLNTFKNCVFVAIGLKLLLKIKYLAIFDSMIIFFANLVNLKAKWKIPSFMGAHALLLNFLFSHYCKYFATMRLFKQAETSKPDSM